MKRWLITRQIIGTAWIAFFLFFISGSYLLAKELKVGVVDVPYLLEQFAERRAIKGQLEKEFTSKDSVLKKINLEIKTAQENLQKVQTDEERRTLERSIINLEREYSRLGDEFRQDFNLRRNEELYKIQKQITDTILEFAKKNDFDLILESGLIYAKDPLYITDQVLELLDGKYSNDPQ